MVRTFVICPVSLNTKPVNNAVSDSLVLFRNGNIYDVYDASTANLTTFDLGSTPGVNINGGNIILTRNSNYSKFYAFQKGRTDWTELISEGNSMAYYASRNTAAVIQNTIIYAFAPEVITGMPDMPTAKPQSSFLCQNYPNPFKTDTKISWQIAFAGHVTLKVYDFTGRDIMTLVDENQLPGEHQVTFYVENLPSGIYFYQLLVNNSAETKKMLIYK